MLKRNKDVLFIALLCLLPIIYGYFLYDKIPEMVPTHWNFSGEVDKYTSKFNTIVCLPLFLFISTIFAGLLTKEDPKNKDNKIKIIRLNLIILPLISNLLVISSIYAAMGYRINIAMICKIFISIIFIIIGNYIPKLKRNYTIGIKTPWTLNDDEIWLKTHRFGGKLMILQGILILISILFNNYYFFFGIILLTILPIAYSYISYKKRNNSQ
ncbi:SdpI family protein [Caviibacter abscessus]|uniref:SdpI family protein n=1 Tax=Caviibacter abscessus TaxID=1766719 RepID=UPI000837A713|nr:SdpI family protein [Caviibacter abscessus]